MAGETDPPDSKEVAGFLKKENVEDTARFHLVNYVAGIDPQGYEKAQKIYQELGRKFNVNNGLARLLG